MQATVTRAAAWWRTHWTRGTAPRALPDGPTQVLYGLWLAALVLKMLGSTWDMSWHFRWLRDDLAPPHLINSVGTALVIALVLFHSHTGYAVDRAALRLLQLGTGLFLVAVPLDVLNHRLNGLDLTAWSATHALLYLGTAIMVVGLIRGWSVMGPAGRWRVPVLGALWFFVLEAVWFPAQQQEYGVLSVAAWDAGRPSAEPILLEFAAQTLGRPVDRTALLGFALPVPAWVYPVWVVAAGLVVLVLARLTLGRRWAATAIATAYVGYRCLAWLVLVGGGFPPSAVPFLLLAGAVVIDLVYLVPTRWWVPPLVGSVAATGAVLSALSIQAAAAAAPPSAELGTAAVAAVTLGALWLTAAAAAHRADHSKGRSTNSSHSSTARARPAASERSE